MAEYIRKKLYEKYGNTKAVYRTIVMADIIQTLSCLLIVGYFFNSYQFIIIGSAIMVILSSYSYHFHCKNLNNCTILTTLLFVVFNYISQNAELWVSLMLCMLMFKDMYIKMPLKLVNKKKSEEWHKKHFVVNIVILLFVVMFLLSNDGVQLASDIIWSINMYGLLFFVNENKFI